MKLIVLETHSVYYVEKKLLLRILLRQQLDLYFIDSERAVINRKSLYWLFEFANEVFI